jgi:hypothetical protein
MVLITETKNFIATNSEKFLIITLAVFTIALTQFVIVPYDISSYFFLMIFFFILIKQLENTNVKNMIWLVLLIAISTLNRESSAISISLAATLLYSKFKLKKKSIFPVMVLGITFLIVYLGMRFFNKSFSTNDGNLLAENLSQPKNILGALFWMVFFVLTLILAKDKVAIRNILIFHLLSIPYIFMCIYSGILYEIRLYVPLFLTSIFLAKTSAYESR